MFNSKRVLAFACIFLLPACASGRDSGAEPGGNYLSSNNGFPLDPRAVEGVRPVLGKTWASGSGTAYGRNPKAYDKRTAGCNVDFNVVGEARWCTAGECDFAYSINIVPFDVHTPDNDISIEECELLQPQLSGRHDLMLRGVVFFLDGEAQPGSIMSFDRTAGRFYWEYPLEEVGWNDESGSRIGFEFEPDALMYL